MNNMSTIWQSRLEEHIKETRMYMKYMLNDHLVIVLIFLLPARRAGTASGSKTFPFIFRHFG